MGMSDPVSSGSTPITDAGSSVSDVERDATPVARQAFGVDINGVRVVVSLDAKVPDVQQGLRVNAAFNEIHERLSADTRPHGLVWACVFPGHYHAEPPKRIRVAGRMVRDIYEYACGNIIYSEKPPEGFALKPYTPAGRAPSRSEDQS